MYKLEWGAGDITADPEVCPNPVQFPKPAQSQLTLAQFQETDYTKQFLSK